MTAKLLDSTTFRDYLTHRGESCTSLALKVTIMGAKAKPDPVRCSRATIGHLMTETIRGTSPVRARLIEDALNAPRGSLFLYEVSRVGTATGRAA